MRMEKTNRAMLSTGSATVPITKPLVRTRVTYSRLMMSQSLRIAAGNSFDEDIVQGRLHELKTRDAHPALHGGLQDLLRVRSRLELRLDHGSEAVHTLDQSWHVLQEVAVTRTFDPQGVLAVRSLDGPQFPLQDVLSLVDQA